MSRLPLLALVLAGAAFGEEEDIRVSQKKVGDSDVPINIVEGVIDAPSSKVWAIISRCGDYEKTMPRIVKSKELSREGDEATVWSVKCEVTAHLPFPLPDLTGITQATHTVTPGGTYSREWTLVSGDYEINTGSWTLVSTDEGRKTQATYKLRVKPKIHLPMGLIASAQKSALKDVIARLRETVKTAK